MTTPATKMPAIFESSEMKYLTTLVFLSLFFAVAGCDSRAILDASPLTCGNRRLEPHEECEWLYGMILTDTNRNASCLDYGFHGGDLDCTLCALDFTGCQGTDTCDPLQDTGCAGTMHCYLDSSIGTSDCHHPGNTPVGKSCFHSPQCQPGHTCVQGKCETLCMVEGVVCPTGGTCGSRDISGGYLTCHGQPSCHPVSHYGCANEGEACYLHGESFQTQCMAEGQVATGDGCSDNHECMSGHICSDLVSPGNPRCMRLCGDHFPCKNAGESCAFSKGYLPGVCLATVTCTPMEFGQCSAALDCTIINQLLETACTLGGTLATGHPCDLYNRCLADHYCDSVGGDEKACRKLCYIEDDCPGPDECHPLSAVPGTIGVCK